MRPAESLPAPAAAPVGQRFTQRTVTTPSIAVVIPVHRGGPAFARCLDAVARMRPRPAEVVVVVDGTDHGEGDLARAKGVRVVRTPHRCGPAVARNLGAAATASDVVFFLDADVLARPTVIAEAASYLAARPDVQAVIGSYDDAPPETNFASQYKNLLNHFMHQRARVRGHTFWGACGLVRRDAFDALGGFLESYDRPCIEDIEFGYRLRAAGGSIHVVKTLQVTHMKRWGWRSLLRADVFFRALPWSELILLTRHMQNDLNVDVAARVKVALTGAATAMATAALVTASAAAAGWAVALCLAALALDWPLWRFLAERRDAWFAVRTMPWHAFYHFYSGAAFAVAAVRHLATTPRRWRARRLGEPLRGHTNVRLPRTAPPGQPDARPTRDPRART
ncbi:MAG TPA: glycosyltransferase [Egibacteraceae bacterium]|nr:glycosyltransferase [Egibacteraceae bacterium]